MVQAPIDCVKETFYGYFNSILAARTRRDNDEVINNVGKNIKNNKLKCNNTKDWKHDNRTDKNVVKHLKVNELEKAKELSKNFHNDQNNNTTKRKLKLSESDESENNYMSKDFKEIQESSGKSVEGSQTELWEKDITENNENDESAQISLINSRRFNNGDEFNLLNASKDPEIIKHLPHLKEHSRNVDTDPINNDDNDNSSNTSFYITNKNKINDTSEGAIKYMINKFNNVSNKLKENENFNIRTLRQKLLDYLLDYIVTVTFDNVTDPEYNETITLEDRLKNYYISNHLDDTEREEFNFNKNNQSNNDDHVINSILNETNTSKEDTSNTRKVADEHKGTKDTEKNRRVSQKYNKDNKKSNTTKDYIKNKANSRQNIKTTHDKEEFELNNGSLNNSHTNINETLKPNNIGNNDSLVININTTNGNGDKHIDIDERKSLMPMSSKTDVSSAHNTSRIDNKNLTTDNTLININNDSSKMENNETSPSKKLIKTIKFTNQGNRKNEMEQETDINESKGQKNLRNDWSNEKDTVISKNLRKGIKQKSALNEFGSLKETDAITPKNNFRDQFKDTKQNDNNKAKHNNNDFKMARYNRLVSENHRNNEFPNKEIHNNNKNHNENSQKNIIVGNTKSVERGKESIGNIDDNLSENTEEFPELFNEDKTFSIRITPGKNKAVVNFENKLDDYVENKSCNNKNINTNKEKDENKFKLILFFNMLK